MNSFALATRETGIGKMLPSLLFVMAILCAGFFVGCETTKKNQADANAVIREPDKATEIHGEVGAMYGSSSLSRH
jgi:hypothetical protein